MANPMTWTIEEPLATFHAAGWRARGSMDRPALGWQCTWPDGRQLDHWLPLHGPNRSPLPRWEESYVRGGDLIGVYPQAASDACGLHAQMTVLDADPSTLTIQWTLSVQTSRWDCQPTLDVDLPPRHWTSHSANALGGMPLPAVGPAIAPATLVTDQPAPIAIFLSPRDQSVTGLHRDQQDWQGNDRAAGDDPRATAANDGITLRLFEEFLEKGVIRKAVLWFVASQEPLDRFALQSHYARLCQTPLPLTT
jgi:hypothetical protein